jgi:hypothetical protein
MYKKIILKGLSQNGGQIDFSESLRALVFNEDLLSVRSISLDSNFKVPVIKEKLL